MPGQCVPQRHQVSGIVLQVGVQGGDPITAGRPEARHKGRRLPRAGRKPEETKLGISRSQTRQAPGVVSSVDPSSTTMISNPSALLCPLVCDDSQRAWSEQVISCTNCGKQLASFLAGTTIDRNDFRIPGFLNIPTALGIRFRSPEDGLPNRDLSDDPSVPTAGAGRAVSMTWSTSSICPGTIEPACKGLEMNI